jgi:hypothetical protein
MKQKHSTKILPRKFETVVCLFEPEQYKENFDVSRAKALCLELLAGARKVHEILYA